MIYAQRDEVISKFLKPVIIPISRRILESTEQTSLINFDLGFRTYVQYDSSKDANSQYLVGTTRVNTKNKDSIRAYLITIGSKLINPCFGKFVDNKSIKILGNFYNENLHEEDIIKVVNFLDLEQSFYLGNIDAENSSPSIITLQEEIEEEKFDDEELSSKYLKIINCNGALLNYHNYHYPLFDNYQNTQFTPILEQDVIVL